MSLTINQIIAILPPMIFLCAFIGIPIFIFYKNNGLNPFNFSGIRNVLALFNIIYIILALSVGFIFFLGRGIEGEFMLAGLIIFGLIQWFLINNDKLSEILYFHRKNIKIILLNSFYLNAYNFTVELTKEKGMVNFYCIYIENPTNPKVFVIREIDNTESITFFTLLFWENFSKNNNLQFLEILDFAKNCGMIIKKADIKLIGEKRYEFFNSIEKGKSLSKLLLQNNISFEIKRININTSTEQEIANLPMINVIYAKKIKNHIVNNGNFKNFWEFAKFVKLSPNQGRILSKLVFFDDKNTDISQNLKQDRSLDI